jgi:hypothetical protein
MNAENTTDATLAALKLSDQLGPLVEAAGMVNFLNYGAASHVSSEGCHGVTQEHLERFAALLVAQAHGRWDAIVASQDAEIQRLRAAALSVVVHMEGRQPVRGWLKDNDKSRDALAELVRVLGA